MIQEGEMNEVSNSKNGRVKNKSSSCVHSNLFYLVSGISSLILLLLLLGNYEVMYNHFLINIDRNSLLEEDR